MSVFERIRKARYQVDLLERAQRCHMAEIEIDVSAMPSCRSEIRECKRGCLYLRDCKLAPGRIARLIALGRHFLSGKSVQQSRPGQG
jgi:hypothetical protein